MQFDQIEVPTPWPDRPERRARPTSGSDPDAADTRPERKLQPFGDDESSAIHVQAFAHRLR